MSATTAKAGLQRAISVNERLQTALHPWTSYVVVPLFALANAGVDLGAACWARRCARPSPGASSSASSSASSPASAWARCWRSGCGWAGCPRGVGEGQVVGGAALSGIGFTVSLLITGLAFESQASRDAATLGVLVAAVRRVLRSAGWSSGRAARFRGERTASLPMVLAEPVDPGRDHIRGRADAALTLVEYGDFECPFCGRATGWSASFASGSATTCATSSGTCRCPTCTPAPSGAARAAEAAGAQGRFWEMHDLLFPHQERARGRGPPRVRRDARASTSAEFVARPSTPRRWPRRVREDVASAEASGARGTPTFFVGRTATWRPTTPRRWPAPWRGHGPAGRRVSGGAARPPGQWRRAGPALPRRPRCRAGRRCPSRS